MSAVARGFAATRVRGGLGEAGPGGRAAQLGAVGEDVLVHKAAQVVLVKGCELHVRKVYRLSCRCFRLSKFGGKKARNGGEMGGEGMGGVQR